MSAVNEFRLPDLGEGLEEGEITAWHVAAGDRVELNQPLCSIETAKAEVDIPSPYAGTVVDLAGEVGDVIPVGSTLVTISSGEEPTAEEPAADEPEKREALLVGYGVSEDTPRRRRRRGPPAAPVARSQNGGGARPRAKPPVRKLAKDLGVDLAAIGTGSGHEGTITREDVRAAAGAPRVAAAAAPAPAAGQTVPLRGVRRTIAEHLTRSRREIPDATAARWADATALLAVRDRLRDDAPGLTPFALLLRLVVAALERTPALNARIDIEAGEITLLDEIHLGVAVDTPHGLMVPVVRDAHQRSTADIAAEVERLAAGARDRSLRPDELVGSTFTVSNFGVFGLDEGIPVINPPGAAILGVGAIKPRPWVVDGDLAVRRTVNLTCAFDHRVSDGAQAGSFLGDLAALVEAPERLLLTV